MEMNGALPDGCVCRELCFHYLKSPKSLFVFSHVAAYFTMGRKFKTTTKKSMKADRQKVMQLRMEGYTPAQIVRLTKLDRKFVYRSIEKAHDYGNLQDRPKGRPEKKLTPQVIARVRAEMKGKSDKSTRKVSQKLKSKGIDLGRESVRKAAHATGMKPFHHMKKPLLTKDQQRDRKCFAKINKNRDWSKVMFVDEKAFHLLPLPNSKNDVTWEDTAEEVPIVPRTHVTQKLNVFGGISARGKTNLYIFKENLTGPLYKTILQHTLLPKVKELYPRNNWALYHDNDPKHTSRTVQEYISEEVPECIETPANSPDLNIIENAWSIMGDEVAKKSPSNLDALKKEIKKAWNKTMTPEYIESLLASMPKRLKDVKKKKGGSTNY